ncbi:MAG: helix-turn-helix domain-containing protein [Litorimonas sp.]
MANAPPIRDRLIIEAARLFAERGYHGVGVAEVLEAARAPKGSLYHHFPAGKSDLALAAAAWASDGMLRMAEDAYASAPDFDAGTRHLCAKLAKLFDQLGRWTGCPVSSILFEGPANRAFHDEGARIFEAWIDAIAKHGMRLGLQSETARRRAEAIWIGVQGAWTLARARADAAPLLTVPDLVQGA